MSLRKVSELSGVDLDYAVARALGYVDYPTDSGGAANLWYLNSATAPFCEKVYKKDFKPSTGSYGDIIIDREKIATEWCWSLDEPCWQARIHQHSVKLSHWEDGATRREAAMRCFVYSKLGDNVEVPEPPPPMPLKEI